MLETQLSKLFEKQAISSLKDEAAQKALVELKELTAMRIADARGALAQYRRLADVLKSSDVKASTIRQALKKREPQLYSAARTDGKLEAAEKLVDRGRLNQLTHLINHRFFGVAYNNLGTTPMNSLQSQLEQHMLRGRWRRFVNISGAALLGSTILFALASSRPIRWQAAKPPITVPSDSTNKPTGVTA